MEMIAESLRPGGMVMKSAVVMTVVQPRPMFLRASLGEADLQKVRPGMKGTAQPAALPELKLPATVSRVDKIPSAADSFEVRVQVQTDAKAEALVPGMTCSVKIVSFSEKNVLTIPAKALMLDEADETKTYVFVVRQGKPEKRDVTVGKRADDRVQIVRGLAEGDEVLLEKPKETKPDQPKAAAEKAAEKKKDEKQASQPKAAEKEKAAADAGKEKKPAEEKKEPAKKKSSKPKGKGKKKSPESSSATK
jgi:RND family efflux transporter MFP subunit